MKQIRVLQILDTINSGSGVAAVVLNYYRFIEKDKIQFDFMIHEQPKEALRKELEKEGAHIYVMPQLRFSNTRAYQMALKRFFNEHPEEDMVHGHMPHLAALYLRAAKRAGISVRIIHSHNSRGGDRFDKCFRNRILSWIGILYANHYMACGKIAADYLYGRRSRKKIDLVYNAIDGKKFEFCKAKRERVRKQLGWENNFVIGHIGRFCEQKNQRFLIPIFQKIVQVEPMARLIFLGAGKEQDKIKEMLRRAHLENHVKFVGVVLNVQDYLQAMDVFVLPSRFEGFPVVCVEAQASGLPCVISDRVTKEVAAEGTDFISLKDKKTWIKTILANKGKKRVIPEHFSYEIREQEKTLLTFYQFYYERVANVHFTCKKRAIVDEE